MRTKLGRAVGAVVAVGALASVPAVGRAAIMVDDFTSKTSPLWPLVNTDSDPTGGFGTTETGVTGTINGERDALIVYTEMDVPGFDSVRADVYAAGGFSFLDVASSAGAKGTMQLLYNAPSGLVHAAEAQALRISFLSVDLANGQPLGVDLSVTAGSSGSADGEIVFTGEPVGLILPTAYVTTPGAQVVDIPLASYWAQFGTLTGMELEFTGGKGADYRIDSITLVPEPGMAAGLAIATGATALRRRRA